MDYDVLIIGAGAAGLTAAIYCNRKKLKTLNISVDIGGQSVIPSNIENYPGFQSVPGSELMLKFQEQAIKWGAQIKTGRVTSLEQTGDVFTTRLDNGEVYQSKAVILTFGKTPKTLGIPGEKEFLGRGVTVCVTCDAPLYKGKKTVIIGSGTLAIDGALELSGIASQTTLLSEGSLSDEAKQKIVGKPITLIEDAKPIEVLGNTLVSGLKISTESGEQVLETQGVFIELGYMIQSDFLQGLVELNPKREVIVDAHTKTSHQGIFAAGDVTDMPYKQTVVSAGDGAKAALEAYRYISGKASGIAVDWTH